MKCMGEAHGYLSQQQLGRTSVSMLSCPQVVASPGGKQAVEILVKDVSVAVFSLSPRALSLRWISVQLLSSGRRN